MTAWFETGANVIALAPLADGSVAVAAQQVWTWVGVVGARATSVDPAPPWLTAEQGRQPWIVRGGRAMAFAPLACTGPECGFFDLVLANGQACGRVDLPGGSDVAINVGLDGTVFAVAIASGSQIRWRWWSKLLAKGLVRPGGGELQRQGIAG